MTRRIQGPGRSSPREVWRNFQKNKKKFRERFTRRRPDALTYRGDDKDWRNGNRKPGRQVALSIVSPVRLSWSVTMELVFKIGAKNPDPHLGIVEGFIQEGINQISILELILVSAFEFSESDCEGYIGRQATLGLGDLIDDAFLWSRFDGIIYEFHVLDSVGVQSGLSRYRMVIRPNLWDLNFTVRAKSFPDKSRIEVIEEVLKEWGFQEGQNFEACYFKETVYPKITQILQNQVSDLAFVQNLMTEAGINYYFRADKSGDKREMLRLADSNAFFGIPFKKVIPYNPESGLVGEYKIESLETHFRSSIGSVVANANFGDGSTRVHTSQKEVDKGYVGTMVSYGCAGQDEQISIQDATTRMQYFRANQVTYEGRSNHFIIRPGEKNQVGDKYGNKQKEILITSVFHHFRQTDASAIAGDNRPEYRNLFCAVRKCAEYRPEQTSGKSIVELKRSFTNNYSVAAQDRAIAGAAPTPSDILDVENYNLKRRITELKAELSVAKDLSGLMIGTVIEDARVTTGKELVCRVMNEKFPQGLTIKVALGWLTRQGWLYLLPRKGVQVYFQFLNGQGGQNEAVMVGYRPTAAYPVPDPTKTTPSTELTDQGDPGNKSIASAKFAPVNRYRNSLMGEDGVAEVAVVDGEEATVYIHANNRICGIGDKSISLSTASLYEGAGSCTQQFGTQDATVNRDYTRTVGGITTHTTTGNVSMNSQSGAFSIRGSSQVLIYDKDAASIKVEGTTITAAVPGDDSLEITSGGIKLKAGSASVKLTKDNEICAELGSSKLDITTEGATLKSGASKIEMTTGGTIDVTGNNITVHGQNVRILGDSLVKLNC